LPSGDSAPQDDVYGSVEALLELTLSLIDKLSALKLSAHIRAKAVDRRREIEQAHMKKAESQRQELIQVLDTLHTFGSS
jgi:hypothetical protein